MYEEDDFNNAIECYKSVFLKDSNNFIAYSKLGNCYNQLNDGKHAILSWDKSIEINPEYLEP